MEILYVAVIVQLVVSLYLCWKVFDLTKEIDDTQIVVGSILHDVNKFNDLIFIEDDEEETHH
jgi:hypothetical protein